MDAPDPDACKHGTDCHRQSCRRNALKKHFWQKEYLVITTHNTAPSCKGSCGRGGASETAAPGGAASGDVAVVAGGGGGESGEVAVVAGGGSGESAANSAASGAAAADTGDGVAALTASGWSARGGGAGELARGAATELTECPARSARSSAETLGWAGG